MVVGGLSWSILGHKLLNTKKFGGGGGGDRSNYRKSHFSGILYLWNFPQKVEKEVQSITDANLFPEGCISFNSSYSYISIYNVKTKIVFTQVLGHCLQ